MRSVNEQQLKHNDCGISAAKIIYNLHNIPVGREYIEDNIFISETGSSLHDIKDFFESQHFDVKFNLLDVNSLKFDSQKIKDALPCILSIKNRKGLHFVVIQGLKNKKLKILDPADGQSYLWSFSELMHRAHYGTVNYDLLDNTDIIRQIVHQELGAYNISSEKIDELDTDTTVNKLTYFSYLKENFGFANESAEKNFLQDLLFNQDLSMLPKQFRAMKIKASKIKLKVPVVLTIKKGAYLHISDKANASNDGIQNPYYRLYKEMSPFHKLWGIYIVTAILVSFFSQFTLFKSQVLIDHVLPDRDLNLLLFFAFGLMLFKIFNLMIGIYKKYISIHLENIFDNYFLTSFVEKLNMYPIRYIQTFSRGDLTERIKDSLKLKTFFIKFFTRILIDAFVSIAALVLMFIIHWKVTLIVVAVLVIFVAWFYLITPFIRSNENRRFFEKSNLFSALFENIDGLQVIKSFRMETVFLQRLIPRIKQILAIQKRVRYVGLVNSGVVHIVITIASTMILLFLSRGAILFQDITAGQIITYIAFSSQVFSAVRGILDESLDIQENEIILSRYFDFGKEAYREPQSIHQKIIISGIECIEFNNVGFSYLPNKPILSNLNIKIHRGERIHMEGRNGTGKSTFCKVLSLLYPPDTGEIYLNGEKFSFYQQGSIRKKILLVSNEDILFNDTLGYNMAFEYDTNTSTVLELAKELGFYEFISEKTEGLDFIINEQGRNLSTGQRKKILLMRAFLSKAELIILDETLSGIDRESREKIENYINRQVDRSFIIISHEPLEYVSFTQKMIVKDGAIEQLQLQYQGA
ncbi:ABC transporter transmembrane domain-containing protein [Lunatibacter salilacus]|uniref:ABC transporter transmembrane domain-containing protein n=1 Tax=Lunatibacter salilacus TaxID=2483804 RepID=UPI00131AC839|nr:ABC transporter transmembrane domain-containing protein [Lunatibacter salilacus]